MTKQKFLLTFAILSILFVASCNKKEKKLTFEVKDSEAAVVEGAKISINGSELTTDQKGMANIDLLEGDYKYSVKKEGFSELKGNVVVSKDDVTEKVTLSKTLITGSFELDVKDRTKWYYFSFKDGLVGEGSANPADGDDAKWKEKTNWDLAFHNSNVRSNSGNSGNGQAGVLRTQIPNMDEVTVVPEGDFHIDTVKIRIFLVMPPIEEQDVQFVNGNIGMNLWADFFHDTQVWKINKNIYVVRTADGKYAKVQFENYLDENDHGGLMKFNYVYQSNGSKEFK